MSEINCDLCDGHGWYLKKFSDNHRTICIECNGKGSMQKETLLVDLPACAYGHDWIENFFDGGVVCETCGLKQSERQLANEDFFDVY